MGIVIKMVNVVGLTVMLLLIDFVRRVVFVRAGVLLKIPEIKLFWLLGHHHSGRAHFHGSRDAI